MNIPANFGFADAIWEYCVSTNEVFLYYDTITPELCDQWIPYHMVDGQYQESYIYPSDVEIWRYYLSSESLQRFYCGSGEKDYFYIRFTNADKKQLWYEVCIQKAAEDSLILSRRISSEVPRLSTIAKAAMTEFDYISRINVADGSYVLYHFNENQTIVPQSASASYEQVMQEFNRLYVSSDEVERLTNQMRLECVKEELEKNNEYVLYAHLQDKEGVACKKLRFSYEDEEKQYILLTRLHISEVIGEQKSHETEQNKLLGYLEDMPVAFCSIKVLLDEDGKPYDFQFTYCNHAHEELENTKAGELVGKNFYEYFENADSKWLKYYYETAYEGIHHVIHSYSPEIQKYLVIYTFRSEFGHCECVLLDESEQHFLIQELEHSHDMIKRILDITTNQVFEYLPDRDVVLLDYDRSGVTQTYTESSLRQVLLDEGLLHPDDWKKLRDEFLKMKSGEHKTSFTLKGKLYGEDEWKWMRTTMFDFQDKYTHERKILGFLQDIDEFKVREENLRQKAEQDALTGVLNPRAGKKYITQILRHRQVDVHSYYIMFVMDLDNFKTVNDTQGHGIGDKVLIEFSRILCHIFRSEDIIYRLGGDEFVVFVAKSPDAEQSVHAMLQRLMIHVETAKVKFPFLGCSVGAFVTDQQHSFEECYQMADQALYKAKNNGKGGFYIEFDVTHCE